MFDFTPPSPTHLCTNPECREREWTLVRLGHELWRLRSGTGAFTMAACEPACPVCGAPLLDLAALAPDLEGACRREASPGAPAPNPPPPRHP